jgi:acetolactate synthase regulatory subunit
MEKLTFWRRLYLVISLILLGLLASYELIPLTYQESEIVNQIDSQAIRAQRIYSNALTLAYRPQEEHAQSISEMQNTLPAWEGEQSALQSLRLNENMRVLVVQAQPDYVAIDTAARKLIAHPGDKVQVEIIVEHRRNYVLLMTQLSTLYSQRIPARIQWFVALGEGITLILLAVMTAKFVIASKERHVAKAIIKQQGETIKQMQEASQQQEKKIDGTTTTG